MKKVVVLLFAGIVVRTLLGAVALSNVKVQQRYPWTGKMGKSFRPPLTWMRIPLSVSCGVGCRPGLICQRRPSGSTFAVWARPHATTTAAMS